MTPAQELRVGTDALFAAVAVGLATADVLFVGPSTWFIAVVLPAWSLFLLETHMPRVPWRLKARIYAAVIAVPVALVFYGWVLVRWPYDIVMHGALTITNSAVFAAAYLRRPT